ncbi:MAG: hypothetical protein M0D53_15000 [Flavobacterium sp. JAD_PAG50586_2]|nr:MAG: hypothetical protein M0D53_15000 [Flavobacterium sp. JAD_PAG50586_2]
MENRKGINFFFAIIAIIVGSAIYKQFDFEKVRFEKPALAVVYIVVFIASIFFIIKDYRKRS